MARAIELRVFATALDTETGQWCDTCLLPSRITTTMLLVFDTGQTLQWLRRVRYTSCPSCEPRPRVMTGD